MPIAGGEPILFHGVPAIAWRSRDGASAIATLQGAQVVSWIPSGGEEGLFLSERSAFEAGKAVRGGIPVCFPQFADRGPLPQHGFARTQPWTFAGTSESGSGLCATFWLETSAVTRLAWPHAFRCELAATIGGSRLEVRLRVINRDAAPWAFTAALHAYFRLRDSSMARLHGLRGVRYVNRGSDAVHVEGREDILAGEAIDRVYFATPGATRLGDATHGLRIEQQGFTDTVVWNPGAELTARMADMPRDGDRHMLCVEAAAIEPPVTLQPGAEWTGTQAVFVDRAPPASFSPPRRRGPGDPPP